MMVTIHWYVEANMCSGGVEGAIILLHAAFEVLAWTVLVEERNYISADGFGRLPMSDLIALLLAFSRIPNEIPLTLPCLRELSRELNWNNAAQALVGIRNALVHPTVKVRRRVMDRPEVRYEAWSMCLWLLELAILRVCGYEGSYSNRVANAKWKGQEVEPVPWMQHT